MKPKQMKQSEKALILVVAVLAGLVIASVALSGVSKSRKDSENLKQMLLGNQELRGFNRIDIQGDWQVNVTQGDEWQVEWSGVGMNDSESSESAHHMIQAYVKGDTLNLTGKKKGKWWSDHSQTIRAEIVMPELRELDIVGGVQVELSGFEGDELNIEIAGAAQLNAEGGHYNELNLGAAGASDINLRGITVEDVELDIAGASDVILTMAGGKLSGSLAGAGQILYYGEVSEEDVDIAGFGNVAKAD